MKHAWIDAVCITAILTLAPACDAAVIQNWFAPTHEGTANLELTASWTDDADYGNKIYMWTLLTVLQPGNDPQLSVICSSDQAVAAFGENYVRSGLGEIADASTTRGLDTYFRHAWIDDPQGTAEWTADRIETPRTGQFDFYLAFATDALLVPGARQWDPSQPGGPCCYGWVELRYSTGQLFVLDSALNTTPEQGILVGSYVPVPEPASGALALLGAILFLRRRRRIE